MPEGKRQEEWFAVRLWNVTVDDYFYGLCLERGEGNVWKSFIWLRMVWLVMLSVCRSSSINGRESGKCENRDLMVL